MKTKNIIQSSVNVIRLVNLKKGDIFKTVKTDEYDNGIQYNVVVDLYNTGESAFIEILSYTKSYKNVTASTKVISGDTDLAIFPATIDEVSEYFIEAIKNLEEDIKEKEEEINKSKTGLLKAKEFIQGELSKKLSEAEFKEQTQEEYSQQKAVKEAKIKELAN